MEEIRLEIITTFQISNQFSQESPYISNAFSRESPKFQTGFHMSKRSPRLSEENPGKLDYLEIQICLVWSPLWVELQFVVETTVDMAGSHCELQWGAVSCSVLQRRVDSWEAQRQVECRESEVEWMTSVSASLCTAAKNAAPMAIGLAIIVGVVCIYTQWACYEHVFMCII